MGTPFRGGKRSASYFGGTRNGAIVSWPNGFLARGEIRDQFHHVIDVASTVLDAAGLPEPATVNGVTQTPLQGVSMRYCFDARRAADRRDTQHFGVLRSRSIYHQGWTAVAPEPPPARPSGERRTSAVDGVWELYDSAKDWAQASDVAADFPEKLAQLQRLWLMEAVKFGLRSPDDDPRGSRAERLEAPLAGRKRQVLSADMPGLPEAAVLNLKNRSHTLTADIVVVDLPASGVLICQGAGTGGWAFYVKDGRLRYGYNWGGVRRFDVDSRRDLTAGQHQVRMDFAYDGGGVGRGGEVALYVDGREVGRGRIEATLSTVFSASLTAGLGTSATIPAGRWLGDYSPPAGSLFNGESHQDHSDRGQRLVAH